MKESWVRSAMLAGAAFLVGGAAQAAGTLTVGMTAGDLPVTTGNPDQGFEGYRFVGYNLYDSLVLWDLSGAGEKAADIKPGLATEWHVDEGDSKRWIFTLRQGVKWHDGCPFTADDVVWNFGYSGNEKAPQFNAAQFARRGRISAPMPASKRSTTTPSPLPPRCPTRSSPT